MTHTFEMFFSLIILGIGLVTSLALLNYRRFARLHFELEPNCLLTRYPLLFLPGRRSLIYFLHYWNQIPEFLAAHGYEVFTIPLPWRDFSRRRQALLKCLRQMEMNQQKFHLILDQGSLTEIESLLLEEKFSCIESITCVTDGSTNGELSSAAIEQITILPDSLTGWRSVLLQIHNSICSQDFSQNVTVGWAPSVPTLHSFLSRAQHLAERDLIKNS